MAANLNVVNGRVSFGILEDTGAAWHGSGEVVSRDYARDMMGFAEKSRCTHDMALRGFNYIDGNMVNDDSADKLGQVVYRMDTGKPVSVVGPKWQLHQHNDSWRFLQTLLDTGLCHVHTCGALGEGETVFASIALGGGGEIRSGDAVQNYLTHIVRHRFGSILNLISAIRVVCQNTASMAESAASSKLRIRHSQGVTMNVKTAMEIVNLENENFQANLDQWRKLATIGFCFSDVEKYVKQVFDIKEGEEISTKMQNTLNEVCMLALRGVGNTGTSLWDAYNGVTEYLSHHAGHNWSTRTESLWFGTNAKRLQRATDVAFEIAGIGA